MIELGVNIDHVATVRQARRTYEPDPVWAAVEAHLGGADGITVHLREDRRHIQDDDVRRLRELVHIKLNLEMAATDEMVKIARDLKPQLVILDAQLPDISGFQVCQMMKRDRALRRVPVVMVSSRFTEPQDRIQGLELGADDFFTKPFDPVLFVARIKNLVRSGLTLAN